MTQQLHCANCHKDMGVLRDARVRNGMVVYCAECNTSIQLLLGLAPAAPKHQGPPDASGGFNFGEELSRFMRGRG